MLPAGRLPNLPARAPSRTTTGPGYHASVRGSRTQLVLVLVLVAALALLQAARPFFASRRGGEPAATLPVPGPCGAALTAPQAAPSPAGAGVPALARAVESLRELTFREVPEPDYLPPRAFAERVAEAVDYPKAEADRDARALSALGAVPPGTDLEREVTDLLEAQVVGFYDTETKELVVRAEDVEDGLDAVERLTLVHELEHALADQALDLPDLDDPAPGEEDATSAALAVVEGDASLATEMFAARGLTAAEQLSLLSAETGARGLAEAPYHLARSLLFPYAEGKEFVCGLFAEGGWEAVDAAYADPPTTTAQVLFPDRYRRAEEAAAPSPPGELPAAWEPAYPVAFGAADLLFLFEAPGGDPARALDDPLDRAAAWAGGTVHVWERGSETATALLLVEREGEPSLCRSVAAWYRAAFPESEVGPAEGAVMSADGPDQDAVLRCAGEEVRLGTGPDPTAAEAAIGEAERP